MWFHQAIKSFRFLLQLLYQRQNKCNAINNLFLTNNKMRGNQNQFNNISVSNSLFTLPTWTKDNCLVLSVSVVWTQLATRQDSFVSLDPVSMSFVLSRPSFQFATVQSQIYWGLLKAWQLETGVVLSAVVFTLQMQTRKDSLVLSCLCRQYEQAIIKISHTSINHITGVSETLSTILWHKTNCC